MKKIFALILLVIIIVYSSVFAKSVEPIYNTYNPEDASFSVDEEENIIKIFFHYFPKDDDFFKTSIPKEERVFELLEEGFSLVSEGLILKEHTIFMGMNRAFLISYTYEITAKDLDRILNSQK